MEHENAAPPPATAPTTEPSEAPRSRNKRGGSKRGPRGDGEGNRQRSRGDRAMAGYGDGVERAYCMGVIARPPRSYPAQHRTGVAVLAPAVVARGEKSMLFCDGQHDGPHIWPNGDIVD